MKKFLSIILAGMLCLSAFTDITFAEEITEMYYLSDGSLETFDGYYEDDYIDGATDDIMTKNEDLENSEINLFSKTYTFSELKKLLPSGTYWNHKGVSYDKYNKDREKYNLKSTNKPCNHKEFGSSHCSLYNYTGKCGCNVFSGSAQCMAFARFICNKLFGKTPNGKGTAGNGWKKTSIDNLKPGDYIRYRRNSKHYGHSVVVIEATSSSIKVVECNHDGKCGINWGRKINKSTLKNYYMVNCLTMGGVTSKPSPEPQLPSYNTSKVFPTPIKCYALEKCTVYSNADGSGAKGEVSKGDECKIKEIYTNGYAKITASKISGSAYVKMSVFTKGTGIERSDRVSSTQKVYRHSDLKTSIGEVYKSDSIKVVYESGNNAQIIYPLDSGGYKMGWIAKSKLVGNGGSSAKVSGIPTPIKAYTKSDGKTKTYKSVDGKETGYIAGDTDLCTIKAVYTNGWVKVTYPTSSGEKTAYAKSSAFASAFNVLGTSNPTSTQTVYRRSNLKEKLGEVYKSDSVKIIGEQGSNLQIIYPINGGYKMGWIKASKLKPVVKNIKTTSSSPITVVAGQPLNTQYINVIAEYLGGAVKTLKRKLGLSAEGDEGYVVKNAEFEEEGTQTVAFEYEENDVMVTDSLNVDVIEREMTDIEIQSLPYKTNYIEGEELDVTGMTVIAKYNDGTEEFMDDFAFEWYDEQDSETSKLSVGEHEINVVVNEFMTSFKVTVVPKTLISLSINTAPAKTTYVEGQSFDAAGLSLIGKYNNSDEEIITEGYTLSTLDSYTIGEQNIIVSYDGQSVLLPVTVIKKQPTAISIDSLPDNTNVLEGSLSVDTTGLKVKVDYNDGTSGTIEGGYTLSGYEPRTIGKQTLTINFCGFETTFDIEVVAKSLTRLEIDEPAEITEFIEGEDLDTSGMIIYGYYNNGDVDEIIDYELSGYDSSVGPKTVVVSSGGLSVSYEVNVRAKTLIGVEIESEPEKTEYYEDETLDTTGLEVVAVYDNGDRVNVPVSECRLDGFDNTPGLKSISVSYGDSTAIFEVEVSELKINSFTLDNPPSKLTYNVGEELELDGISMTVAYENGRTEQVNVEDCVISGYDKDTAGVQTVVVSYREASVCFVVNVKNIVDNTAILKIGSASAIKGSTIAVPVNIVNNTGLSQFKFDVTYDKAVFKDFDVAAASVISDDGLSCEIASETEDYVTQTIAWKGADDITNNGTVLTMYLTVLETAESNSYPIEVVYDEDNTLNKAGEKVKLNCMHGTIIVEEGDVITRVVSGDQTSIAAGGVLNYDVTLSNNTGLSGYKLNVKYDTSAMKLVNVTTGRLFGDFKMNYADDAGTITITGVSDDVNKQNGTLLKFEFTTAEDAEDGNYPIQITYVQEETYVNESGAKNNVALNTIDGEVAIAGYVLGDINGDGRVNNFDAMALVGYVNNDWSLDENRLSAADITGDGVIDYLDYASLSAFIIGLYEDLNSDCETVGGSVNYVSKFVGGANTKSAVIIADEITGSEIGEYVEMNADLYENPGMSGYIVTLNYDVDDLELVDIRQKDTLSGGKFAVNTNVSGEATVMWSDDKVQYGEGSIFTAVFKLKKADKEEILVKLSYNSEHTGYIDEDMASVPVSLMSESGVIYPDTAHPYITIDDVKNEGSNISGSITINKCDIADDLAKLYIAAYDEAGQLLNVITIDADLGNTEQIVKKFELQANEPAYIKAFLLDSETIAPITKAKMYEF